MLQCVSDSSVQPKTHFLGLPNLEFKLKEWNFLIPQQNGAKMITPHIAGVITLENCGHSAATHLCTLSEAALRASCCHGMASVLKLGCLLVLGDSRATYPMTCKILNLSQFSGVHH